MDKYRTLKQKHAVLKEAYLNLEENVKIITQNSEAKIIDYDCRLSRLNTTLSDKDEEIKCLKDEINNLQENKQIVEHKLTNYIKNEEIKANSFIELTNNIRKKSIYDDSIDSLYELSCRTNTAKYIKFNNTLNKFLSLLNEAMKDNQHTISIEGNVQVKLVKGKFESSEDSFDSLEPLVSLNLDLLRYMDKMKFNIRNIIFQLQDNISLELSTELIRLLRLYLTIEEYLFPDIQPPRIPTNEEIKSKTTLLIKSLAMLDKNLHNLRNTLLHIHRIINTIEIDDFVKLFTWSRCEHLLNEINTTIKNIAEIISHRMCFPKICNGKFLPLTGSTETLIDLYELLIGEFNINMNIAVVLSSNFNEFQVSIDELLKFWINKFNEIPKPVNKITNSTNRNINEQIRLKELEIALAKSEINAFIANYQRKSLLSHLNTISEIVNELDNNKKAISNDFKAENPQNSSEESLNLRQGCHEIDYLISPLSLSLNNGSSSELAGYVTTLIKDGMNLAENNLKMTNELSDLKLELNKERDRREAAEESCRASINELTRHLGTMEQTIIDYESKISQLKKGR